MKRFIDFLDRLILKYHKCKNYAELYSYTIESFGVFRIITHSEYRCSICNKQIERSML